MKKLLVAPLLVAILLAGAALPLFAADEPFVQPGQGFMPRIAAIVIDPGHGGKDSGAVGEYEIFGTKIQLAEKDIALTVAKDLYALLKDKYPGKTIHLTRSDDRYPSLEERLALVNRIPRADNETVLYISLHTNSSFNHSNSGFEVWRLSPEYQLARSISDGLNASIGREMASRGIKNEEWDPRDTPGPSVMIELGFLNNPHDLLLLSDPDFIRKTVLGLSNGIDSFITLREKGAVLTE